MEIRVTSGVLATLLQEAARASPEECCGLLLGTEGLIDQALPTANVASEPNIRFEIDPLALLAAHKTARAGGAQVIGYYHSHPAGHPVPSATDCEHSTGDSRIWAIVAGTEVAFWRDSGKGFVKADCRVVSGKPADMT